MNRFILDADPAVAAKNHCDKHVVKMILEEAQMLCAVQRRYGATDDRLYRATHANHPCTLWAGATKQNYRWAYVLFAALCDEYTYRYEKVHATSRLLELLRDAPKFMPEGDLTPFAQAVPDDLRDLDAVSAYRQYYIREKAGFARWTKRPVPDWYDSDRKAIAA